MNQKMQLSGSFILVGLLAAIAIGWAMPQDGSLLQQELDDCQLDVRPKSGADQWNLEAQVYFEDWKDSGAHEYGSQYTIHTPKDNLLKIGDHLGSYDDGTVNAPIKLQRSVEYRVQLFWDSDDNAAFMRVLEDGTARPRQKIRSSGGFDPLGLFEEPRVDRVRTNDSNPNKVRLRLTAKSYGVETAFTVANS